ncbi:transporter substrate-binding domain-containing protein [Photobacterium profundum]|uniref:transporter substrate-binding domain-containing protein n=1 Tax=Photobacterium profundum TaxID=74109 RepID=UPI003D0B5328
MLKSMLLLILFALPSASWAENIDNNSNGYINSNSELKTLRIGFPAFDWTPFSYVSKKGRVSGLLPSLMHEIAKKRGYRIQAITYPTYQDVLNGFNNHEVDILVGVSSTFERQKVMSFSKPILTTSMAMITKTPSITSFKQIDHQLIAVEQGFAIGEQLTKLSSAKLQMVNFPTSYQAFNAVLQGVADVYIGNSITLDDMRTHENANNDLYLHVLPDLPYERLYVAAHREQSALIDDLNKGYQALDLHLLTGIYDTWLTKSQQRFISHQNYLNLNNEEAKWLEEHSTLRVAYHPDDFPYQFTDKDNLMAGRGADVLSLIARQLKITLVPLAKTDFPDILKQLNEGKIDVVAAVTCTPERAKLVSCTTPYSEEQWIMVGKANSAIQHINKKMIIGTVSNRFGSVLTKQLYSSNPQKNYNSNAELLDAIVNGNIDTAVISLSSASVFLQNEYLGRLNIIPSKLDFQYQPVGIAVASNNVLLRDLLNKAMNAIPPQKLINIESKWNTVRLTSGIPYQRILLWGLIIIGCVVLIVSFVVYWNRKLSLEIGQRKAAEQKLTYLTNNFDGVLLQHLQRSNDPSDIELLFVSEKVHDLLGINANKLYQKPEIMFQLLHRRDDSETIFNAIRTATQQGYWKTELKLESVETNDRWVELRCHITPQDKGWQWNSIIIDISQMKRQQLEVEHARQQAESATEAKSRFLAMMSHEIRTPISGILSLLELMIPYAQQPELQGIHENLTQSGRNLLNIVNDVLDFSKNEAGKLTLAPEPSQISSFMNELVQPHVVNAQQKGVNFRLWVDPTIAHTVLIDELRLKQVINNLLNNAIKFTESGTVSLLIDVINHDENSGQQILRFTVNDTGIGITEADQLKLFQPFEQVDLSSERRFSGTGLGLSICRQLIQLMDSEINVGSQINQGTTFSFNINMPVIKCTQQPQLSLTCGIVTPALIDNEILNSYLQVWDNTCLPLTITTKCQLQMIAAEQQLDVIFVPDTWCHEQNITPAWAALHLPAVRWVHIRQRNMLSLEPSDLGWIISQNPLMSDQLYHALTSPHHLASPSKQALVTPLSPVTREQAIAQHKLILVAEDHPINQQIIQQQLHHLGYVADIVDNGQLALQAMADQQYDLLLTDCHMPELDGYGLTAAIRLDEKSRAALPLPIIALTANALSGEEERSAQHGFDAYLVKPVSLEHLQQTLSQWLPITSASPTSPALAMAAESDPWDLGDFSELMVDHAANNEAFPLLSAFESVNKALLIPEKETSHHTAIDITKLSTIFGDIDVCTTILQQYVQSCHLDFNELENAIERNNQESIHLISHRMKGAAKMMEFNALAAVCEEMESANKQRDVSYIPNILDKINKLVHSLEQQVESLV